MKKLIVDYTTKTGSELLTHRITIAVTDEKFKSLSLTELENALNEITKLQGMGKLFDFSLDYSKTNENENGKSCAEEQLQNGTVVFKGKKRGRPSRAE